MSISLRQGETMKPVEPHQTDGSFVTIIRAVVLFVCWLTLCGAQPCRANIPYAWGFNGNGELGNATRNNSSVAQIVAGGPNARSIAVGLYHALVATTGGDVWAWGQNQHGQIGDGTTNTSYTPKQVMGLSNIKAVSAGEYFSMALKTDGTVWTWGENQLGQLGNNSLSDSGTPVQVIGLTNVTAIAAAGYHGLALKSDGTVWAWGNNYEGETGNGDPSSYELTPVRVVDPNDPRKYLSNVVAIAGGKVHSLALKSDGTVRSWGYNGYGELGNGTTANSSLPVKVSGLSGVVQIAGGSYHSLALKSDGTASSWGHNDHGQLGNGSNSDSSLPTAVMSSDPFVRISAGMAHCLAITRHHTVMSWGYNGYGQLGNNTTNDSNVPVQVIGLYRAIAIAGGGYFSLAQVKDPDPDFNLDGNHDLVLQNVQTGDVSAWFLDGPIYNGANASIATGMPTDWKIVGTADLNGDGNTDLIWQNNTTGDVIAWFMNGATYVSSYIIAKGVPTAWKIVGVADLNNDLSADLIWQNNTTGDVLVWYMSGATYTGQGARIAHGVPTDWKIVGTADLNGDGNPDLIWENTTTGAVNYMLLNGHTPVGAGSIVHSMPLEWRIASVEAINGDGYAELIWQNSITGDVKVWYMNGTSWTGVWDYIAQGVPTDWQIARAH
jgi:alpha-tubulin suppressor-like RCC1 family protein